LPSDIVTQYRPCIFCADFNFTLYYKKIEIDCGARVECSYKTTPTYETMNAETTRHNSETVVKYADGSIYEGHLTRDGQRTGIGKYRCPITLYGEVTSNLNSLMHWTEFVGTWENDEPTTGCLFHVCGDGTRTVEFEGNWRFGLPVRVPRFASLIEATYDSFEAPRFHTHVFQVQGGH